MNGFWWKTWVVFLGVALAMPGAAYAERPFLATEHATLLEHGEARFDFGVEAARFSSRTTRYTLKSELTSGILPNLNFRVEAPY
ncbi:MAG TPA: hypothetical protein VFN94_10655, partial [Nitrospiria bacterium]|nr:hypothetical protein [Nitrospiria bacterium]